MLTQVLHAPPAKARILCAMARRLKASNAIGPVGIGDTARVLHVRPATVIKELKKRPLPSSRCIRRCGHTCTPRRGRWSAVVLTNSLCHNRHWTQLDINDTVRQPTHGERRSSCVCSKRCSVRLRGARGTGRLPQANACPRQGPAMRCH